MSLNIFNRKANDPVRVPEIEVRGDRLDVHRNDQGQEQDPEEQNPETSSYRLPKTKWWL